MTPTNIFTANYIALPGLKPGAVFYNTGMTVDHIINIVGKVLDITEKEMCSIHRYRRIVEARQIAMYMIRKHTTRSFAEIGTMFGGRDHTTAIHSINTVKNLCLDETYKQRLLQIENLL